MVTLTGIDELHARRGDLLGVSSWHRITQEQTDQFAELTGDHQPIHVDPVAARATPFGQTITHGYHTLALGAGFSEEIFTVEGFDVVINYGLNRVRFPAPLTVGARVRMSVTLASVREIEGGAEVVISEVFDAEGGERPVCVADVVLRLYRR